MKDRERQRDTDTCLYICTKLFLLTSNRVLQHYTSNPLNAYTGRIDQPVFKAEYYMISKEHSGRVSIYVHISLTIFNMQLSWRCAIYCC